MSEPDDPIFIISLPRSGSTLLQRLIMTSGEVITWSETWVLLPFLDMFGKIGFPSTAVYAWSTVKEAARDRVVEAGQEYETVKKLYRAYVESEPSGKRVLDKTPRYYLISEELLRVFPNSKIVVLTRDLNDIVNSIRHTWWSGRLNLYHHWLDLHLGPRLLDSFIDAHAQDRRVLAISYEDLLENRDEIEERLQRFLDMPTINFSKLGQSVVSGQLGDPSNRNSTQIGLGPREARATLTQYLLVKYLFGMRVGKRWKQRLPGLTYNPWRNAKDFLWVAISWIAIRIKFSQWKATIKHPYKWS